FSSTVYIDIDEQGRIVLPRGLRLFSSILKKVVIAGVGDHFEIWSLDRWELYIKEISSEEK
ncbi:cell division/cell wall cluster transcriptional repressor MraZ, partial [Candidatus Roizmanbacteria bacterium CG11_big_fil_rev_8_21_14_0_20_36_8]